MEWITNRNTKEHQAGKGINTDLHRMEHMEGAKRRVFEGCSAPPQRVLALIKEEMKIRSIACVVAAPPPVSQ